MSLGYQFGKGLSVRINTIRLVIWQTFDFDLLETLMGSL